MSSKPSYPTIIIGAGIAGLSAAYKLHKQGEEFLLIEAADRVGGNWASYKYKNSIYEFGPNTLMNRSDQINQMIQDLGIEDQVLTEKFKDSVRYLYLDNKFYEIGSNPLKILLSGILSPLAIIRAALEPLIPASKLEAESVYDFVSRRFGKEVALRIVSPALQGIWAGDTSTLSAKAALKNLVKFEEEYGSVIKGLFLTRKKIKTKRELASISFHDGMQYLTQAIADSLPADSVSLDNAVLTCKKNDSAGFYTLTTKNGETIKTANLMIAVKAYQAAALLESCAPALSEQLNKIYYAPIFLMAFTLPKKLFTKKGLKGFGYISAEAEHLTLGTIFSSELFHERNLDDEYLLQSFIGGAKNTQILDFPEGDLILRAIREQKEIFKNSYGLDLKDNDFNIIDSKFIKRAIPQYGLDFPELKSVLDKELKKTKGLKLLGNYLNGVSIPDTLTLSLGDS